MASAKDVVCYLDDTPGEVRGIVVRDGAFRSLYIQRTDNRPEFCLGARVIGRVTRVEPGLKAAFIDMGGGDLQGFLPLGKTLRLNVGEKIEVRVTAEPRESKGPVVKYVGPASGEIRLVAAGPSVAAILAMHSQSAPVTGLEAVRASLEAQDEASQTIFRHAGFGLDLAVERTRALISVDIDYAPEPGRDSRKGREAVNREGLNEAARIIGLKAWAGTVAIDLAGVHLHAESIMTAARSAFSDFEGASFGPLSKFGLVQLALPWGRRPVDEMLVDRTALKIDAVRQLNLALLEDRATPRWVLECPPSSYEMLEPLVSQLGPRAALEVVETHQSFKVRRG